MRVRRHLASVASALVVGAAALGALAPAAQAAPGPVLNACQKLTAGTTSDALVNGNYRLWVTREAVDITQTIPVDGPGGRLYPSVSTWFRDDVGAPAPRTTTASYLAFYCNGDLSLRRSDGHLIWHTDTAGRGATKLALTSGGNLVMYDTAGRVVWQSGSGQAALGANSILRSNSKLTNLTGDQYGEPVQTLAMQTNGNLVYREGTRVRWQSGTSVAGARAALTTKGQLIVQAPDGRILWRTAGTGTYAGLVVETMEVIELGAPAGEEPGRVLWRAPLTR